MTPHSAISSNDAISILAGRYLQLERRVASMQLESRQRDLKNDSDSREVRDDSTDIRITSKSADDQTTSESSPKIQPVSSDSKPKMDLRTFREEFIESLSIAFGYLASAQFSPPTSSCKRECACLHGSEERTPARLQCFKDKLQITSLGPIIRGPITLTYSAINNVLERCHFPLERWTYLAICETNSSHDRHVLWIYTEPKAELCLDFLRENLPAHSWLSVNATDGLRDATQPEARLSAAQRLGAGVVDGLTGVFLDPIRGGRDEGFRGVIKGFATGLTGVVRKPMMATFGSTFSPRGSDTKREVKPKTPTKDEIPAETKRKSQEK
eukprot:183699_1